MSTHSSTYKGKRVRIKMKDGTSFVDKFLDTKSGVIYFEDRGKVLKMEIKNFTFYKGETD